MGKKNQVDPHSILGKTESLPNEARNYIPVLGRKTSGPEISQKNEKNPPEAIKRREIFVGNEKGKQLIGLNDSENSMSGGKKSGNNLLKDILLLADQKKWKKTNKKQKTQAQPS